MKYNIPDIEMFIYYCKIGEDAIFEQLISDNAAYLKFIQVNDMGDEVSSEYARQIPDIIKQIMMQDGAKETKGMAQHFQALPSPSMIAARHAHNKQISKDLSDKIDRAIDEQEKNDKAP
jgi:hypothetical protein